MKDYLKEYQKWCESPDLMKKQKRIIRNLKKMMKRK